ncbi:MAG: carboxymuconolactone decarboxylase family protein [Ignavibacteriaceae bacterium]|nr:carboxymuconolactone decarboxylase family protein [Ignavibacteriaceae bacterium]
MRAKLSKKYLLPQIAAASAINQFELLRKLFLQAKSGKIPFSKLYETLLQNYLFAGYPSALSSLKILKEYFPKKILPVVADMNLYHFRKKGVQRCRKVYGNKFEKLISNINSFSPELAEWLVLEGYGKVLGRAGLSFKERELCIVAVLALMKFEDQLFSHINGAIKAGASIEELHIVIKNLELLGKKNLSAIGIKVLNRYRKEKGMN